MAVAKLDRLARSVRHLTELAAELEALGVDLVVLGQSIYRSTSRGRFLFHTLAAVAQLERDLIIERTKAGLAAAKRRGKRLGRPRALRAVTSLRLEQALAEHGSLRAAARALGVSAATVATEARRLGLRAA